MATLAVHQNVGVAPLDSLVMMQVEAIVNSEHLLEQRYADLLQAPTEAEAQAWALEVWNLRRRADRLGRMLQALGDEDPQVDAHATN